MGQKDISEKILEDYEDVFADIVNGLVFKGREIITPEDLQSGRSHSQYKADNTRLHEMERDVVKDWAPSNTLIGIYGIENQTEPEKNMVPRVFGYEGASYRGQLLKNRNVQIVPVITIVLYFGTDRHWNYPKRLTDMIDTPDGVGEYVNDFKINVFEIAWLTEEEINRFTSDFKIVANFFVNKRQRRDYIPDDKQEIKHVDELLKLLATMTGDNRYERILSMPDTKEIKNMCDVAERLENIGRAEGLAKGREEGRAEGRALLIKATQDAKAGIVFEKLVEIYGEDTAKDAMLLV